MAAHSPELGEGLSSAISPPKGGRGFYSRGKTDETGGSKLLAPTLHGSWSRSRLAHTRRASLRVAADVTKAAAEYRNNPDFRS